MPSAHLSTYFGQRFLIIFFFLVQDVHVVAEDRTTAGNTTRRIGPLMMGARGDGRCAAARQVKESVVLLMEDCVVLLLLLEEFVLLLLVEEITVVFTR